MDWSLVFSGAGHFKPGRPGWAVAFLLLEALGWLSLVAWLGLSTSSSLAGGILLLATASVRLLSFLHARRLRAAKTGVGEGLGFLASAFAGEFVLAYLIVGSTVITLYRIPSSAMEPTLLGPAGYSHDSCAYRHYHVTDAGDRIMMSRLAPMVEPIRRFDVVVFRFPLNQSRDFVKRVVGLPGEELVIRDGDLFTKSAGDAKFRIARKPKEALWFRPEGGADSLGDSDRFTRGWEKVRGEFRLEEGVLRTDDAEFSSASRFTDGSAEGTGDLRIVFRFQVPKGEVLAKLENGFGRFVARLSSDGRGSLVGGGKTVPLEGLRLGGGSWHSLDFSVRDGLALLEVDGSMAATFEYADFLEDARRREDSEPSLGFGAKGEGILIRELGVWQDVHYRGKPWGWQEGSPLAVPADSYVMLGDNVNSSHDSRSWKRVTFRFKDGRTVECEAQEVDNASEVNPHRAGKQYQHFIAADASGNTVWYDSEDLVSQTSEPFHFVDGRFIKGKVMRIWWPPKSAGPVR